MSQAAARKLKDALKNLDPDPAPLADWSSNIGNEYFERNPVTHEGVYIRERWLRRVLAHIGIPPKSFLEIGAGQGDNLLALRKILPHAELYATEPNKIARDILAENLPACTVNGDPVQNISYGPGMFDFVFTNGCLVHVPPNELHLALDEIYRASRRWILLCEYFSAREEHIDWRASHIWKCDFGARMLEKHPDLQAAACNFEWKHLTGMDHATWWLFLKPAVNK